MYRLLSSIAFLCLLALPLAAQEKALHGTWELAGSIPVLGGAMRLTFEADGTLAFEQNVSINITGVNNSISSHYTGTYRVAGDRLWIDIVELLYAIVNGEKMTPVELGEFIWEFLTGFARDLARLEADIDEISDEDYPAYEQAFVDDYLALVQGGVIEVEEFASIIFGEHPTYAIEGDTLFITTTTDVDGVETVGIMEFQRIDVASAVVQTSWGDLKAAWRP